MREADFDQFGEMLDAICSLLSRGTYVPNATNTALWFRSLQAHPIEAIRAAFDAHVKDPQRGRFVPTPADVIAQLEGLAAADGRPGAEEAWAIVQAGADEAATLVWTDEIGQAWGIAKPVLDGGDEVGARMAFREAYNRLVAEARKAGRPAAWAVTLGHDQTRREAAVREAVLAGRLVADEVQHLLPAPVVTEQVPLLEGNARTPDKHRRNEALARIASIAVERRDPLEWARDLKRRDERGESVTEAQRRLYRDALDGPRGGDDDDLQQFRPIPRHALPPRMQAELEAQERRA
ncbi:MAG: hypothetical protein ACK4PH_05905 [Aquincola tertiaricarbonis]